jgi:hypothetical protein
MTAAIQSSAYGHFFRTTAPVAEQAPAPASARRPTTSAAPAQGPLMAPQLLIEFDEASERFVQILIDPVNKTILRRFPDETQLAFSRGVAAYVRAMRGV